MKAIETPDNVLDYADQGLFLALRATGQESVAQIVWIYTHPVDVEQLRRFHSNLGYGLLGRRVEPSPLPFGRHRWVWSPGPSAPFEFTETPRPRGQLTGWVDERSQVSADPERGPGWHLAAARFDDGSTAVSLVASHCLVDGMGLMQTVMDAVRNEPRDMGLPRAGSRSTAQAVAADLRQSIRALPEALRALVVAVRLAVRNRPKGPRAKPVPAVSGSGSEEIVAPGIVACVDADAWDSRAVELGGNSHSLVAGFAARLALNVGRVHTEDGTVKLIIPVNERAADDTRANAVTLGYASLDPTGVTTSLSEARGVIRTALTALRSGPEEAFEALPLIPFVPKRAVAGGADAMFGFAAELPVSASNLGDIDPTVLRADGTEAEGFVIRGVDGRVSRAVLEKRRGFLTVICARAGGKVILPVIAYRPGAENSKEALHELVSRTLGEFGLTATIE